MSVLFKAVVSSLQKDLIVQCIKKFAHSILLVIGDGVSDISITQTAHVDIGIDAVEGVQGCHSVDVHITV